MAASQRNPRGSSADAGELDAANGRHEARQTSPSVARNRHVILNVLRSRLPAGARVLEIGSGSGEHVVTFARALPRTTWIPSDPDPDARASVAAWTVTHQLANVLAPLDLDVLDPRWAESAAATVATVDAVLSINMIHITPPSTVAGLTRGAAVLLEPAGRLILYGPFRRNGRHTAPSNADFDRWLKERDPSFGVRDLDEVAAEAGTHGLELKEVVEMPANNLCVLFRREGEDH